MRKIGKGLFFKTIVICVSTCVFVHTTGYAAPCLRINLIFDEDKEFAKIGKTIRAVSSENNIKSHIKSVLKEFRPDFNDKNELYTDEFEKYLKKEAEDLDVSYEEVRKGIVGYFKGAIINILSCWKNRNFGELLSQIVKLIFLLPHEQVGVSVSGGHKYTLRLAGKTSFILPIIAIITIFNFVPFLPSKIAHSLPYVVSTLYNIYTGFKSDSASKRHELLEFYIFLCFEKLVAEKVIDLSFLETLDLNSFEPSFSLTTKEFERIEDMISEEVYNYISKSESAVNLSEDADLKQTYFLDETEIRSRIVELAEIFEEMHYGIDVEALNVVTSYKPATNIYLHNPEEELEAIKAFVDKYPDDYGIVTTFDKDRKGNLKRGYSTFYHKKAATDALKGIPADVLDEWNIDITKDIGEIIDTIATEQIDDDRMGIFYGYPWQDVRDFMKIFKSPSRFIKQRHTSSLYTEWTTWSWNYKYALKARRRLITGEELVIKVLKTSDVEWKTWPYRLFPKFIKLKDRLKQKLLYLKSST
ncbi:MAG: hypothetical protein KKD11_00975 [Candidatus Omnitrophica bacterium]|nr:hypothetical protein [Candidatus Omnitrophota bacterium]